MKRMILFRFHTDAAVCRNRLELLKRLNPGVAILGLFGGPEDELGRFQAALSPCLEDVYCLRGKSPSWKRAHGDLALRSWYEEVGRLVPFDTLHYIEWDLLLLDPLEKLFGHIPENGIGLTSLIPLQDIEERWFWFSEESLRAQWHLLLGFVKDKYGYAQEPWACEFPGACMPRAFLEAYRDAEIPELCHDELRVPLFSQVFGFKLHDTRLCRKWFDGPEQGFFNCDNKEIGLSTIAGELAQPAGRRAFHPFRKSFV